VIQVSIIVPVYNEEKTVIKVLEQVQKQKISAVSFEVIVVDDGSKDQSVPLLQSKPDLYSKLVCLPLNQGKGAAVKAGLECAIGEYVLFQDADLEYNPADYEQLLKPILQHGADLVVGSRMLESSHVQSSYWVNKLGNQFLTAVFNLLFRTTFTDVYSCYLVYRKSLIDHNALKAKGWEQHAEILSKCIKKNPKHYEVSISYHGRTYDEGKKIRPYHVFSVLWTMIKERFFFEKVLT